MAAALLALLAAFLLSACRDGARRRTPRVPILVAVASARSVPYEIEATGTVEPLQSVEVTAQVSGLVTRVAFEEGAEVRAGQVLFQIDPRPLNAELARAQAVLARGRAQYENARLERDRAERLGQQGAISTGELDQKRAAAAALAATVRADSALAVNARLELAYATVRAPISGRTGNVFAHVGDVVKESDTASPLVVINQVRPIRVRFTVTQRDIPALRRQKPGQVRVEVAPAEDDSSTWVQGRLAFVDNRVEPETGTLLLKGEFPNQNNALWPGQFVRTRVRLFEESNATVVPATAITNSQTGTYVYVVKPDTTVEARDVAVSRTWRDLALIASGVRPGETVVIDGQLRLSPGAKAAIRSPAVEGSATR